MKTVNNLSTDQVHTYADNVSDITAVCQSYCITNGLSNWFYDLLHNNIDFTPSLPVVNGADTLACGDWCIIKNKD